ncbi:MAG TPA: PAS domain-containing sensor histidine kinase, partial [Chitinophagaceae bacterium]
NQAFVRQYGLTGSKMEGVYLKDFFKGGVAAAKTVLRDLFDKTHLRVSRRSSKADGSELFLEGDYICFRKGDRIYGYFGTQQDVTERKRADQSLRTSEERYRLLANNMMDLVALHLPDGTYTYVSPSVEKLLGYSVEELTGTNPYRLLHPEDIQRIREESHEKAEAGLTVTEIEYRIRKKDGSYIWFSTSTKPITDDSGKVVLLQTVSRDVTERVQTLQQLMELNHQKNKLFSIVAHDLRGPIGNCMSLLGLLESNPDPEKTEKYLGYLNKNAHSLYDLLEDLLMWASNQLHTTAFQPVDLNLAGEIDVVIGNLIEMAAAKKISICNTVKDSPMGVYADKHMLRIILRNLLSNAIKFTYPGGMISIGATEDESNTFISVADNGTGIARKDQANLFSRSSSISQFGTGGERGTGLGLNICRDYVERHNGSIKVESEEGAGSRFTISLPRRPVSGKADQEL